jgi:hypothetical protein
MSTMHVHLQCIYTMREKNANTAIQGLTSCMYPANSKAPSEARAINQTCCHTTMLKLYDMTVNKALQHRPDSPFPVKSNRKLRSS